MKRVILILLAAMILAPVLLSQTITHAWNQQILLDSSGNPSAYDWGPNKVFGYEFQVAQTGITPEVVELGCALPVTPFAANLPAGWQINAGKAKVTLWEVTSGTTGTRLAVADVDAKTNWAWTTLPQPVVLTPGKKYRVVVITGVTTTLTDPTGTVYNIVDSNMYFFHSSVNPPLTQPTTPIKYTGVVEANQNYNSPANADENTYPDSFSSASSIAAAWGMADIGWIEAPIPPALDTPTTPANVSAVYLSELGPNLTSNGHVGGELENTSNRWADISGWQIAVWDAQQAGNLGLGAYDPVAIGTIPQGTALAPGQTFTFGDTSGASALGLNFGSWTWNASSDSAVALLDAAGNVMDAVCVNNFYAPNATGPVNGLGAHWSGSNLSQWSTANSWQRQGSADTDSINDWTTGNGHTLGIANSMLQTPFTSIGLTYPVLSGSAPAIAGQVTVGDKLDVTFPASDGNAGDTLDMSITWAGGLTPAQAGFSGITSTQPLTASGGNSISLSMTGTAQTAGTISFNIEVKDATGLTDTATYTLTIDPLPNFKPVISVSFNDGSGRTPLISGGSLGTTSAPITFGTAVSSYALQFDVDDGNADTVTVNASMQVNPTPSQAGLAASDFQPSAQTAPYNWTPNGAALFAHTNSAVTTFTLTLSADDGNGGTSTFVLNFVVEPQPANAAPSLSVSTNSGNVANNANVVVAPGTTLASLGLQVSVNDADQDDVAVSGSISNVTSEGLLASEFSSASTPVSYTLSPSTGAFNVPVVTLRVDLTADDGNWLGTTNFTFFFVVNRAPSLSVSSNGTALSSGATLSVNYLDTLASLGLSISVDDPDGTPTAVSASVSGVTTQGFTSADFSVAQQAVAYTITPSTGTFNATAGSSHQISLTATDAYGTQATFSFNIDANPFAPKMEISEVGGAVINNGDPAQGGRDFGSRDISAGATAALDIDIDNTGSGPLDLSGITLTGANVSDFILTVNSMPSQLFPGAPFSFSVAFNPAQGGLKQASVEIGFDSAGITGTFSFDLQGQGYDPAGVAIDTPDVPDAVIDVLYGPEQLGASGGAGGNTWSVLSGSLPGGVSLSPQGVLGGTPKDSAGAYSFTIRVTDSLGGTAEQTYNIRLLGKPSARGKEIAVGGCAAGTGSGMLLLGLLALFGLALYRRRRAA